MRKRVVVLVLFILTCFSLSFINVSPSLAVEAAPPQAEPAYDGYDAIPMIWLVKVYGTENKEDRDCVFTADQAEISRMVGDGYANYETKMLWVSPVYVPPLIPMYRMYNGSTHDHFFAIDQNEINYAASVGFEMEGLVGYVAPTNKLLPQTNPVHRYYFPGLTCHLYSFNPDEPWVKSGIHDCNNEGTPFRGFDAYSGGGAFLQPKVGVPGAPYNLQATAVSTMQINLTWTNYSKRADTVRIERREEGGSYGEVMTLSTWKDSYSSGGLKPDTTYYFRVCAGNVYGNSAYSNEVCVKTQKPDTTPPPDAPSGLQAQFVDNQKVVLNWNDTCTFETGYSIERKKPNGEYCMMAVIGKNNTTYTDASVEKGQSYIYRVRAWSGGAPSVASNEVLVNTAPPTVSLPQTGGIILNAPKVSIGSSLLPPNAPSDLTASYSQAGGVNLGWTDNSASEAYFVVERSAGSEFIGIAQVPKNQRNYQDQNVQPGIYKYRVKAVNVMGAFKTSNQASVTVPAVLDLNRQITGQTVQIPVPNAPAELKAQTNSSSSISLTWTDKSYNENGFRVFRKKSGGSYTLAATLPAESVGFLDTGLSPGTQYSYKIKTFSNMGESAFSNEALSKTATVVITPKQPNKTPINLPPQNKIPISIPDLSSGSKGDQTTIVLYLGRRDYKVNGQVLQMDAFPVVKEGRTMLPLRYVVNALRGTLDWDAKAGKITASLGTNTVITWLSKSQALCNGVQTPIDNTNSKITPFVVPPGRTLLPLRFVTESLGCYVIWDPAAKSITINYPKK